VTCHFRRDSQAEADSELSDASFELLFLEANSSRLGRRFAIHHPPQDGAAAALMVYVHPFAEEMNKSRRMAAMQSRALAQHGVAVLQMDLLGCGDSAGDFGEATWEQWVADVVFACQWLQDRHANSSAREQPALWIWGLRAGCLLACEAAQRLESRVNLLFWQPVMTGKTVLQQFLRLKLAGEILGGQAKGVTEKLRAELAAGHAVEVAGYSLRPGLCLGLEQATLQVPAQAGRAVWLELSMREGTTFSPLASSVAAQWVEKGWQVHTQVVHGPAFWQTTEIEDAPALLEPSCTAVGIEPSAAHPNRRGAVAGDRSKPSLEEQAVQFDCSGRTLPGILHIPATNSSESTVGVVVIVGGPQYRVGSHRQFVYLARALASAGYPVLRFDIRGMGDATGSQTSFEQITPDVGAAIDALQRHRPNVRHVVLWGLCDGGSSALLYLHERRDARVAGLCLLNPWVRSDHSQARTQVKHYYTRRLREKAFWLKLLSGRLSLGAIHEFWQKLRTAGQTSTPTAEMTFQRRMALAASAFRGRLLLILSGDDYTAKEFSEAAAVEPLWAETLARTSTSCMELPGADHTFSLPQQRLRVEQATRAWLDAMRESVQQRPAAACPEHG
jgi:exosortase A-associated hydrolase 1/exosortase A-associated hydrolase 2